MYKVHIKYHTCFFKKGRCPIRTVNFKSQLEIVNENIKKREETLSKLDSVQQTKIDLIKLHINQRMTERNTELLQLCAEGFSPGTNEYDKVSAVYWELRDLFNWLDGEMID